LVETREERNTNSIASAPKEADSIPAEEISYVLVPADTSRPLQELTFTPSSSLASGGDSLSVHLKAAFATNSEKVDVSLLQQNTQQQLGTSEATPAVSEDTLKQVAKEGHVEVFNLVRDIPSNKFVGINIYLDEVGMLKRLPLNTRASDFAKQAGYNPPPQFFGDVFLGRIRKHSMGTENMSFRLGVDTDPKVAEWLQRAATDNLEYQMQMNQITGRGNEHLQPAVAGSDGVAKKEQDYSWTQTEEELELVVPLPDLDVASKEITIKFKPQFVQISCRKEPLVNLELFERVDVDGCTWTLERGADAKKLIVTMEKIEQALWPRIKN
jgi:hypothetical protein